MLMVIPQALRDAARRARSACASPDGSTAGTTGTRPDVRGALPQSETGRACERLQHDISGALSESSRRMRGWSDAADDCADAYEATDSAAGCVQSRTR